MQNYSWSHVAIDGDGEVTLYKHPPKLLEGYGFFARHGDRIAACGPGDFPTSGRLRLTTNKVPQLRVVLRRLLSGEYLLEYKEVKYGRASYSGLQTVPCVFTLPKPIVARGKFFRGGV